MMKASQLYERRKPPSKQPQRQIDRDKPPGTGDTKNNAWLRGTPGVMNPNWDGGKRGKR